MHQLSTRPAVEKPTAIDEMAMPAMLAMFLWTFAVMVRDVQVRVRSVLNGELTNEYFELFQGR